MFQRSQACLNLIARGSNLKFHLRLSQKTSRQPKEKPPPKLATDVVNYINSTPEYSDIANKIPNSLLRKYKTPESMYLINKKTAKEIVKTIKDSINNDSPLIEVNPGFGYLSEELLRCQKNPIYMYEMSNQFSSHLCVSIITLYSSHLRAGVPSTSIFLWTAFRRAVRIIGCGDISNWLDTSAMQRCSLVVHLLSLILPRRVL